MPDGTLKQRNPLSGTQVWTVPGRGHRPLSVPATNPQPLGPGANSHTCAFCDARYLDTPPEKSRLVRDVSALGEVAWRQIDEVRPDEVNRTRAEFRRVPNLFEIVSYAYWAQGYGHEPSEAQRRRMAEYISSPAGFDHVVQIVTTRMRASGVSEEKIESLSEPEILSQAYSYFCGGHDVIIARRHYVDNATNDTQLASSGTLTPEEHHQYIRFTIDAMKDLYQLDKHVKYVATFQNWLKPAGASFDHLHKQLVAIDERSVQIDAELARLRKNPHIYKQILRYAASRGLVLAQNEHAVALAGFGHRFPTVAVWPLGPAKEPWEYTDEEVRSVSDLLHAMHAATGAEVPCNEEWYHCPPGKANKVGMRWRILLKWRISTLAGFEGGTRIYLNTLDPWMIRERVVNSLQELRQASNEAEERGEPRLIAPMLIGKECKVTPDMLD
ncbi:DUF4921 domain-containing protein [Boudabousia liubingyangii]|uniref:DUF4921 domain-containing protein n=1 Tax=Boudabousia liubingyangii TaxID=1921764 RepID=A0A1Q5PKD5_9ACTO|nr:DUF4921 family protein [Boudabousia liubingyangii]OKL46684.1 DUF4921 domain-containing protein [Boudabousia liubingyangii]OKL47120.1 DUF4921 domain-containing protein [Boudabousia liubingyangii]